MLSVLNAKYVEGYKLYLAFNNGRTGTADLEEVILNNKRSVFAKLRKKDNFKNFKVKHSTLIWPDELDLAPEYLFYLAFMEDSEYQEQFRHWGYIS